MFKIESSTNNINLNKRKIKLKLNVDTIPKHVIMNHQTTKRQFCHSKENIL